MSTNKLKLISSDKVMFEVEEEAAVTSITVKHLVEDTQGDICFLPNVTGKVLAKVVEWSRKQTVDKFPDQKKQEEWHKDFFDIDTNLLYHLLMAANYMENLSLLNATADKAASLIRGKSPEQIRQTFKIENDFTAEEDEAIRKENAWAFD